MFVTDLTYHINKTNEIYFNGSYALTDASFNQLVNAFADDVPTQLFPDGLPGPGADPNLPLSFSDYDLSPINEYSNIELEQLRLTLGYRLQIFKNMGLFAAVSYWDVEDNQPYIENYSGEVKLLQGGFNWTF
jgi:hypothetical protein